MQQWVGTCIGVRNYAYFIAFIASVTLGSIFQIFACTVGIIKLISQRSCPYFAIRFGSLLVLGGWSATIAALVGGLFMFHTMLMLKGQTTSEYLRHVKHKKQSDFRCCCIDTKLQPMCLRIDAVMLQKSLT